MTSWEIREGDVLQQLQAIEDDSISCVVTSPPYWGLRDYNAEGQIGLERTPEERQQGPQGLLQHPGPGLASPASERHERDTTMIENRDEIKAGTLLTAKYRGIEHILEAEAGVEANTLEYRDVATGNTYSSLSKAANAITGNSVNGWRFWSFAASPAGKVGESGEPSPEGPRRSRRAKQVGSIEELASAPSIDALPDAKPSKASKAAKAPRKSRKPSSTAPIYLSPVQSGLEEGQARYFCRGCMETFIADAGLNLKDPTTACGNGHTIAAMTEMLQSGDGSDLPTRDVDTGETDVQSPDPTQDPETGMPYDDDDRIAGEVAAHIEEIDRDEAEISRRTDPEYATEE